MFDANRTVFIIGAGASWHYGYPTGEELVKRVIQKAEAARKYFNTVLTSPANGVVHRPNFIKRHSSDDTPADGLAAMKKEWEGAISECNDLIERLTAVDPLVIDYFLGQNPHLEDIGKLCIAWVLLECEAAYLRGFGNPNRREVSERLVFPNATPLQKEPGDNWCRFIIHKLVTGCPDAASLEKNRVSFVTFNYDVSLESELFRGLSSLAQFAVDDVISKFLAGSRVLHIYGKIRDNPFSAPPKCNWGLFGGGVRSMQPQPGPPEFWTDAKHLLDTIYEASKGIRIIAPRKVNTGTKEVMIARKMISESKVIYILGYGFDRYNSELLDLRTHLNIGENDQTVMFTNFGNQERVNKQVSRSLFGNRHNLLGNAYLVGGHGTKYLAEKSIRNVYDALAFDFDSPEEEL